MSQPTDQHDPPPTTATVSPADASAVTATHYVLGGTHVGAAIAERLRAAGHRVAVVDETYEPVAVPGKKGDPAAVDVMAAAGIDEASTVVVATASDRRNLLVAQLARARFDAARVLVLVNDPERLPLFEDAGHEAFCVTAALSAAVGERV